MFLYNSYCYSTLQDVADTVRSQGVLSNGDFVQSVNIIGGTLDINILTPSSIVRSLTLVPPSCSQLGFNNSFFGITPSDSVSVAWLSAAVLIAAYSIKVLRRGA